MAAVIDPTPLHNWHYYYVLPDARNSLWHDIHQQRLDRDPEAHVRVRTAIAKALGLPLAAVEVKAVCVDQYNDAYTFTPQGGAGPRFIARPKTFSAATGRWKPDNKRFLARVQMPHSSMAPIVKIDVGNVARLPSIAFEYAYYERNKVNAATANSDAEIQLTLCSPLIFAVQAHLAYRGDLPTLGAAFLDIIMVCAPGRVE
jgi:hypothetical protein